MIGFLLIGLLTPFLVCFVVLSLTLFPRRTSLSLFLLKASLSVGLGIGFSSVAFLLVLLDGGPSAQHQAWLVGLPSTAAVLAGIAQRNRSYGVGEDCPAPRDADEGPYLRWIGVLFWFSLVFMLGESLVLVHHFPHGAWDAWAGWNLRARFLLRGGENWLDLAQLSAFFVPWYPLLVPAFIAECWCFLGHDTWLVPPLVGLLYTLATVGLVAAGLTVLRSCWWGGLGGLVLTSSSLFVLSGTWQTADAPVAFYMTATVLCFCLVPRFPRVESRLVLLAGVMAGFAAWTKREGLAFLVCVSAARLLFSERGLEWRRRSKDLLRFLVGALPGLLALAAFEIAVHNANPDRVWKTPDLAAEARIWDPGRWAEVIDLTGREVLAFGNWILPSFLVFLLLIGLGSTPAFRPALRSMLASLAFLFAVYLIYFFLSPDVLEWHAKSTVVRLFGQIWPSLVFLGMMAGRKLEKAESGAT